MLTLHLCRHFPARITKSEMTFSADTILAEYLGPNSLVNLNIHV